MAWFSPAGIPRGQCEQFVLETARGAISAISFEDAYLLAPNGSLRVDAVSVAANQIWAEHGLQSYPVIPPPRDSDPQKLLLGPQKYSM
jgi:hypothetical protein